MLFPGGGGWGGGEDTNDGCIAATSLVLKWINTI